MAASRRLALKVIAATAGLLAAGPARAADLPSQLTLDWAYYNPVSLVLKQKGWLEEELKADGIEVQLGAEPGLQQGARVPQRRQPRFRLDRRGRGPARPRSTATRSETVWVYSKPEWTALVTRPDTGIAKVEDLKGKRIAVTKGTDPYIFLLRALGAHGLSAERRQPGPAAARPGPRGARARRRRRLGRPRPDDGRCRAVERASRSSSATPTPTPMACSTCARLRRRASRDRRAGAGGLRARPAVGARPIRPSSPTILAKAAKLPEPVAAKQLERTAVRRPAAPGEPQRQTHPGGRPGAAERPAMIKPDVDVAATVDALLQPSFAAKLVAASSEHGAGSRLQASRRSLAVARRRRRREACAVHPAGSLGLLLPRGRRRHLGAGRPPGLDRGHACCRRLRRWPRPWPSCGAPATSRRTSPRRCWRVAAGFGLGLRAGDAAGRAHRLLRPRPPAARPDPAGPARHPLDRLGAAVHPVVRDLRDVEGGADRDRRVLPGLSRR